MLSSAKGYCADMYGSETLQTRYVLDIVISYLQNLYHPVAGVSLN